MSVAAFVLMVVGIIGLYGTDALFSRSPFVIAAQILAVVLMLWARMAFGRRSFHASADPTAVGSSAIPSTPPQIFSPGRVWSRTHRARACCLEPACWRARSCGCCSRSGSSQRHIRSTGNMPPRRSGWFPTSFDERGYGSSRTQMLRKLIGGLGSPCACSLIGAPGPYFLYSGLPM